VATAPTQAPFPLILSPPLSRWETLVPSLAPKEKSERTAEGLTEFEY